METANEYPGARAALEAMVQFLSMDSEESKQISANIRRSISAFASAIDALTNEENICRMQKTVEAIALIIDRLSEICIDTSAADNFVMLDEATVEVLQEVAPLIPEEKREEYKEIVTPQQGESAKIIAFNAFCQILTLILMVVTILNPVSLDQEAKEIMREQNAIGWKQIEVDQERNDIEQRKAESIDKLVEKISEFIECAKQDGIGFSEQINIFRNDLDSVQDDVQELPDPIDPKIDDCENPSHDENSDPQ